MVSIRLDNSIYLSIQRNFNSRCYAWTIKSKSRYDLKAISNLSWTVFR